MSAGNHTYSRSEKLKSRKVLSTLFTGGKTISVFPVKLFWMPAGNSAQQPVQAGVGVSARHFSKAVDRNRIKRLLREGYRLNKQPLLATLKSQQKQIAVFFFIRWERIARSCDADRENAAGPHQIGRTDCALTRIYRPNHVVHGSPGLPW